MIPEIRSLVRNASGRDSWTLLPGVSSPGLDVRVTGLSVHCDFPSIYYLHWESEAFFSFQAFTVIFAGLFSITIFQVS